MTERRLRLTALAKLMGMSRQKLSEYAGRPGCPRERVGNDWLYLWPDFVAFYGAEREKVGRHLAKPQDFDEAKTRKMAAEAELAEVELAKVRGDVVTVEDATKETAILLDRIRGRLLALPPRLGVAAVGVRTVAEGTARMEPLVHEVLEVLAGADAS